MNFFLTGKKGVGKSTLICRILEGQGFSYGGFRTVVRMDEGRNRRVCHMVSAFSKQGLCDAASVPCKENRIFYCRNKDELFPAFQNVYEKIFAAVEKYENRLDLILMDELGAAERRYDRFRMLVNKWLDADIPVLGVLQQVDFDFLEGIKRRRDVALYEINEDNRETFAPIIGNAIRMEIKKGHKGADTWNCL